jgi:hypothetical protein
VIPAEAVEAAAKVLIWEQSHGSYGYHPEGHPKRDDMDRYAEKHARAALEAAAPYMMRAAWDEGYTIGNRHDGRRDANPYMLNNEGEK